MSLIMHTMPVGAKVGSRRTENSGWGAWGGTLPVAMVTPRVSLPVCKVPQLQYSLLLSVYCNVVFVPCALLIASYLNPAFISLGWEGLFGC